jgi:iron complex transport system ATP-binding protein
VEGGYRNRPVLTDVTLSVRAGEMLALIGPNGAGKTTLLRVLTRQLGATAGAVMLDGIDLRTRGPEWVARRMALALQVSTSARPLTVSEAVALGRAPHRGWLLPLTSADREAVRRALERTGLGELRDRPVTDLSAGKPSRRAGTSSSAEPAVLLVDEPTRISICATRANCSTGCGSSPGMGWRS